MGEAMLKNYDHDIVLDGERDVNWEEFRQADAAYAAAMARLSVTELIDRMRSGPIDEAYGAALEMARREEEATTEAGCYFGALPEGTISCGACGRSMDQNADAHVACKRAR